MEQQAILKIFGTGQITIPKKWRDFFNADTVKAVFNKEDSTISIRPVKLVELEETKLISPKRLSENLAETGFNEKFKKELLDGYKKSDFYQSGMKSKK
jgi:bifunctional DNA-binding transcriptional regulator/antitoxin component of YhaV-PrlF toxin-antitoxin module